MIHWKTQIPKYEIIQTSDTIKSWLVLDLGKKKKSLSKSLVNTDNVLFKSFVILKNL